jgi:hypothetical protein
MVGDWYQRLEKWFALAVGAFDQCGSSMRDWWASVV